MNIFSAVSQIINDAFQFFLLPIPGTKISFIAFFAAIYLTGFVLRYFKNKMGGND